MSSAQDVNPIIPLSQPVPTEPPNEQVLSLDLEENDFLYRIRKSRRIVYVSVLDGGILPPDSYGRTESYQILSKLQNVPKWDEDWTTLTVRRNTHGLIESTPDEFRPHGLNLDVLSLSTPFYNFTDLIVTSRISDRLSRVTLNHGHPEPYILKIARFAYEIDALQREVSIYSTLTASKFPLSPRFIGYVYEETKARTIGFLIEDIPGTPPGIQHLGECSRTVRLLHTYGVVHRDVNRYNFLMTEDGAKVFDFETSVLQDGVGSNVAQEEVESLADRLRDESGVGRR